jgi:hypothetical protein
LVNVRYSLEFLRRIGRKGGLARARKYAAIAAQKRALEKRNRRNALAIPAAQRKANARAAALKRWQRRQLMDDQPVQAPACLPPPSPPVEADSHPVA